MFWAIITRRTARRFAGLAALLAAFAIFTQSALAAEPAKPAAGTSGKPRSGAARTLDQQLLEDLDNDLLDDVGGVPAKKPPLKQTPAGPSEDGQPTPATDPSKKAPDDEEMGEDLGVGPEDPLMRIGQQMRKVEQLIEKQKSADLTEALREQIVKELAQLIEQLEKQQQQQQQSSSSSKPKDSQSVASRKSVKQSKQSQAGSKPGAGQANQPARESTDRLGRNDVQKPDMDQLKGLMKDLWGQLPAHAREQMLQTSPEQFLPRYELLIEKYYKRLAEQQKHNP